jgi:hypothetical protein
MGLVKLGVRTMKLINYCLGLALVMALNIGIAIGTDDVEKFNDNGDPSAINNSEASVNILPKMSTRTWINIENKTGEALLTSLAFLHNTNDWTNENRPDVNLKSLRLESGQGTGFHREDLNKFAPTAYFTFLAVFVSGGSAIITINQREALTSPPESREYPVLCDRVLYKVTQTYGNKSNRFTFTK